MVVGGRELIDTLWNVNLVDLLNLQVRLFELIDTLWNVNLRTFAVTSKGSRINRYIMECKLISPT